MTSPGGAAPSSEDGAASGSPEPAERRSALVLGATGLVGRHLLGMLLEDPLYARVSVVGRRPVGIEHPRLTERVDDLDRLGEYRDLFAVDDVYCCLGTTIRKAGSREAFRKVDVGYPVEAARLAAPAGAERFLVVSAVGADARSRVFYNRMKGEMEAGVRASGVPAVWIFRPSLLLGERDERRRAEAVATVLARPLAGLLRGRLRRYRPVEARTVASAMLEAARTGRTSGDIEIVPGPSVIHA